MKKFLLISFLIHLTGFILAGLYFESFVKWSAGEKAGQLMLVELSPVTVLPSQPAPSYPKSKEESNKEPLKTPILEVPDEESDKTLEKEKEKTKQETQIEMKEKQILESTAYKGEGKTTMVALSNQKEGISRENSKLKGSSSIPSDQLSIYSIILAQIERHKYYPTVAKKRGIEGITKVTFKIAEDGSVAALKISKPSGVIILDKAAEDTVRQASPFPYIPNPITVPISFSLRDERGKR